MQYSYSEYTLGVFSQLECPTLSLKQKQFTDWDILNPVQICKLSLSRNLFFIFHFSSIFFSFLLFYFLLFSFFFFYFFISFFLLFFFSSLFSYLFFSSLLYSSVLLSLFFSSHISYRLLFVFSLLLKFNRFWDEQCSTISCYNFSLICLHF